MVVRAITVGGIEGGHSGGIWARVPHDLRQPIQTVTLLVDLLARTDDPVRRRELATLAEDQLASLHAMLERLAALGRLENGIDRIHPEPVGAALVGSDIARDLAPIIAAAGRSLSVRACRGSVSCDRALVASIGRDLAINALLLASGDRILVALRHHRGRLALEAWYTGALPTTAQRDAVFVECPRHQHASVAPSLAAGLGLVARLASMIGGRLECAAPSPRTCPPRTCRLRVILSA